MGRIEEERITVAGRAWNVWSAGRGVPLVFLHNGGGSLWNWAHQLEHFRSGYRVIAPDLPGFGGSDLGGDPLTLESYVKSCGELLRFLQCERPILVGNCIGGSIALEIALRAPTSVRALVLFHVCGGPPMLREPLRTLSAWPVTSMANGPWIRQLSSYFLYARGEPELPVEVGSIGSLPALLAGLGSFAVFSQPRAKPVDFPPVFLGWGMRNRVLDVKWASRIASWLNPDELHLVDNAGHLLMLERPEWVNDSMARFVSKLE